MAINAAELATMQVSRLIVTELHPEHRAMNVRLIFGGLSSLDRLTRESLYLMSNVGSLRE